MNGDATRADNLTSNRPMPHYKAITKTHLQPFLINCHVVNDWSDGRESHPFITSRSKYLLSLNVLWGWIVLPGWKEGSWNKAKGKLIEGGNSIELAAREWRKKKVGGWTLMWNWIMTIGWGVVGRVEGDGRCNVMLVCKRGSSMKKHWT